jgi:ATP-dependent Lon protease
MITRKRTISTRQKKGKRGRMAYGVINDPDSESESESESDVSVEDDVSSHPESESESDSESSIDPLEEKEVNDMLDEVDNMLKLTQLEISNSEPTSESILLAKISMKEKARLYQLFEIFRIMRPMTVEHIDMRERINNELIEAETAFKKESVYNEDEQKEMTSQLNLIRSASLAERSYEKDIIDLQTTNQNKRIIYDKYLELTQMTSKDDEYVKLKRWIDCTLRMPFDKSSCSPANSSPSQFLMTVSRKLNESLYGMDSVKEQILLFLNSRLQNPRMKKCSLALIGPPGVGKTAIVRLLADAAQCAWEQISFGGVDCPSYLKGSDPVYVGSHEGELARCLGRMGGNGGIVFFDEYARISKNDAMNAALLHITDPTQHHKYVDSYIQLAMDLSNIWFIYAMNELPTDTALRNRLFVVDVPGYTNDDKIQIIQRYLVPKALTNINLLEGSVTLTEATAGIIAYNSDPDDLGVRTIERVITDLMNKVSFLVNHSGHLSEFNMSFAMKGKLSWPVKVTPKMLAQIIPEFKGCISKRSYMT